MPVTHQTPVNSYDGNAVTTVFAYQFKILAAADLQVTVNGTVQTLTTHYSVSGVGVDVGGNVTMVTAPASGTANVVIRRNMTYSRGNDYQENGDLLATTLDEDVDRPILMIQQIVADQLRTVKLPAGTTTDQVLTESATARALKLLGFDSSGNAALFAASAVDLTVVSAFMSTVLDDTTAAAARATLGAAASAGYTSTGTITMSGASVIHANSSIAGHATTMNPWSLGNYVTLTGPGVTFTNLAAAPQAGAEVELYLNIAYTFIDGAVFEVDGNANWVGAAGDRVLIRAKSPTVFTVHPRKANGTAVIVVSPVVLQALAPAVDTTERTTASTSYVTASNSKAITLTNAANRVRGRVTLHTGNTVRTFNHFTVYRDAVTLTNAAVGSIAVANIVDGSWIANCTFEFEDSPGDTAAHTYTLYWKVAAGTGYLGRDGNNTINDAVSSSIFLEEVA